MRLDHGFTRCFCRKLSESVRPNSNRSTRSFDPFREMIVHDYVNAIEKDRIGIVLVFGKWIGLEDRRRARFGGVVRIIVMMVMTARAVVVVAVVMVALTMMRGGTTGVKMWTQIVSGWLATAMGMAHRCQLR
jgi:hypothetical protein